VDRELVERAGRGERAAYELLARSTAPRLYAVAHRILRDTDRADDAVQNALVAIWKEIGRLRDPDRFEAWTYRLIVRACSAEIRQERRWRPAVRLIPGQDPPVAGAIAGRDWAGSVADREQLERAFRRLSPEQRAVVVLHHYVGLPMPEVAMALEIPTGTATSRLHYATKALRAALDADDRPAIGEGERA
jgi:RNA polymerase sigma-70 factor (ECF subfamily)